MRRGLGRYYGKLGDGMERGELWYVQETRQDNAVVRGTENGGGITTYNAWMMIEFGTGEGTT